MPPPNGYMPLAAAAPAAAAVAGLGMPMLLGTMLVGTIPMLAGTMPAGMLLPGLGIIVGLTFGTMPMLLGTVPVGTMPPAAAPKPLLGVGTMPEPSMGVGIIMPPMLLAPGLGIMPPPAALVGMKPEGALLLTSAVLGSPAGRNTDDQSCSNQWMRHAAWVCAGMPQLSPDICVCKPSPGAVLVSAPAMLLTTEAVLQA